MKKSQSVLAGLFLLITGGMAGVVIYMTFVFPKILAIWEQEAREFTSHQMMMANFSDFCKQYGLILLPVLLLGFLISSVKMMLTIRKES